MGADDAVLTLQNEIVQAKAKQNQISGKMETVELYLDDQKSKLLQEQADDLMREITAKGYASEPTEETPAATVVSDKVVREIKIQPAARPIPKPAPMWFWPKWGIKKESPVSEGEVLYKVAISDNKITMKEAVEIGIASNQGLQALKKKVEVAESKLLEAKRALFPTAQFVTEENGGIAGGRFYKGRNYKVNVNQPVFYGGELVLTVKQAEANIKSSKQEYEKARNDYIHQVRQSYYGVVKAEYNIQYQTELYEKSAALYKRVREEYRQKLTPEIDYLNAESNYYQAHFSAEGARNDLISAVMVLHQTLNLDNDEPLPVDLKLEFRKISPEYEEILNLAFQYNPDLRIKELAVLSAEYGLQVFKAKKLPRVDLRGSYGLLGEVHKDTKAIESDNHDLDIEKEWFVGATVSMPMGPNSIEYSQVKHVYGPTVIALTGSEDWRHRVAFGLYDKLSEITDEKSAQAALLQAKSDYTKSKSDLTLKVRDGFYNIQKSIIQIDSAISKIRYQDKQNQIYEYMLSLQEGAMDTLLDGWNEQAQNKFAFIQAVTDYDLALSDLGVAMGEPFYFET